MLGAVICYGNNTLVAELPTGTMDLQTKLSSIGVQKTADCIPISDEDGDQIRVKLYASSPEEAHLLSLLTAERSLSDANLCCEMLQRAEQKSLPSESKIASLFIWLSSWATIARTNRMMPLVWDIVSRFSCSKKTRIGGS